jgi:hypothetical protein
MTTASPDDEAFPPSSRGLRTPYAVDLLFVKPPAGGGALQPVDHEALAPSLQQSWWWRDAAATVRRCRHSLTVAEEPNDLPHRERFSKFQRQLSSVVEVLDPAALHWKPTQQFIRPANFLEALGEVGFEYPALGALNVRLFAIEGGEDTLMDTLGLGALGLWDLQCHFHSLPPDRVATWMLETARAYFLGEDRAIRDGGTIAGPNGGARWRIHAEEALMAPERVLLDVDPGKPYAAGDRG